MAGSRRRPWPVRPARAGARARVGIGLALAAAATAARDPDAAANALIVKHVAPWGAQGLLGGPAVRRELQAAAGTQLRTIERALTVSGGVGYIGGAQAVAGNAPHEGGELEAISASSPGAPGPVMGTTAGAAIADNRNSLSAGARGPLREAAIALRA